MKSIVLFTLFLLAITAKSQSLKEALYGGKLKADTGAVIRKGDSAKIKENMAQKVSDDSLKMAQKISDDSMKVVQKMIADSIRREELAIEKQKAIAAGLDTTAIVAAAASVGIASVHPAIHAVAENAIPKDNNKIWKTYIDELSATIKSEVLTSDKVKNGTYSVLIDYEIKTDGSGQYCECGVGSKEFILGTTDQRQVNVQCSPVKPRYGHQWQTKNCSQKTNADICKVEFKRTVE